MRPVQPSVVAVQRHVMLSAVPSSGTVNSVIRITGIGDRDRPEWLIRINGMRSQRLKPPEAVAEGQRLQGANRPVTMGDWESVPDVLMIPDHNATSSVTNTPPFMRGFAPPPTGFCANWIFCIWKCER